MSILLSIPDDTLIFILIMARSRFRVRRMFIPSTPESKPCFDHPYFILHRIVSTAPQTAPSYISPSLAPLPPLSHSDYSPTRPLLVKDPMPTLFATDRLALVDSDLYATLGAEVVHCCGRGSLLVASLTACRGRIGFTG
jgi:hypothetical protein